MLKAFAEDVTIRGKWQGVGTTFLYWRGHRDCTSGHLFLVGVISTSYPNVIPVTRRHIKCWLYDFFSSCRSMCATVHNFLLIIRYRQYSIITAFLNLDQLLVQEGPSWRSMQYFDWLLFSCLHPQQFMPYEKLIIPVHTGTRYSIQYTGSVLEH